MYRTIGHCTTENLNWNDTLSNGCTKVMCTNHASKYYNEALPLAGLGVGYPVLGLQARQCWHYVGFLWASLCWAGMDLVWASPCPPNTHMGSIGSCLLGQYTVSKFIHEIGISHCAKVVKKRNREENSKSWAVCAPFICHCR